MAVSLFELFKAGIGPSSSHTVGPMEAARRFAGGLADERLLVSVHRLKVSLYGSLGATGKGHGTGPAVMMGLEGEQPARIDPEQMPGRLERIRSTGTLSLAGQHQIRFRESTDIVYYRRKSLPEHPNGMVCQAFDEHGQSLCEHTYYSVGGGFVVAANADGSLEIRADDTPLPYPFNSGKTLLALCQEHELTIADIMLANEQAWRTADDIRTGILELWRVMRECVQNGIRHEGELPGGLKVRRRAASLYRSLMDKTRVDLISPSLSALDWVNLYALAVNEENAAGGRIVTAPTNGAAGIIPAVLHYYWEFCPQADEDG
ncbi:L-serine ammonia-lyase, partial [Marinobacter salarius]|uniref:L-serine ammonia-lyase n=3 Tax=Marinobacter TaxID=2742 RepID=UPI0018F1739F